MCNTNLSCIKISKNPIDYYYWNATNIYISKIEIVKLNSDKTILLLPKNGLTK